MKEEGADRSQIFIFIAIAIVLIILLIAIVSIVTNIYNNNFIDIKSEEENDLSFVSKTSVSDHDYIFDIQE